MANSPTCLQVCKSVVQCYQQCTDTDDEHFEYLKLQSKFHNKGLMSVHFNVKEISE